MSRKRPQTLAILAGGYVSGLGHAGAGVEAYGTGATFAAHPFPG